MAVLLFKNTYTSDKATNETQIIVDGENGDISTFGNRCTPGFFLEGRGSGLYLRLNLLEVWKPKCVWSGFPLVEFLDSECKKVMLGDSLTL